MRRPSYVLDQQRSALGVPMTPMIDVVFNLLVFFVWTASFQAAERSLPSTLTAPTGAGLLGQVDPDLIDFDRVVIRLRWEVDHPTWQINDRQVAQLAGVRQGLAAIAAVRAVPLVIDAGPDVPLGHVIDVYDVARLEGFGEVQFAATEEP